MQTESKKKFCSYPKKSGGVIIFTLRSPDRTGGGGGQEPHRRQFQIEPAFLFFKYIARRPNLRLLRDLHPLYRLKYPRPVIICDVSINMKHIMYIYITTLCSLYLKSELDVLL